MHLAGLLQRVRTRPCDNESVIELAAEAGFRLVRTDDFVDGADNHVFTLGHQGQLAVTSPAGRALRWVASAAVSAALGACNEPLGPGALLTRSFTSEHFVYYTAPGDVVDTVWQEDYFAWLMDELGLTPPHRLVYYKYRNRSHLELLTGKRTNGFAEPESFSFHTIWKQDSHEVVHVLVGGIVGAAPGLLNEGIAVAHHGRVTGGPFVPDEPHWNGEPVHSIARRRHASGTLPSLDALLESAEFFRNYTCDEVYPLAGSFARYLLDWAGPEPYLEYLAVAAPDDSRSETRAKFARAFVDDLDNWWVRWLAFLESPASRVNGGSPR